MKWFLIAIFFLLFFNTAEAADHKLPKGWREPANDEVTDDQFKARKDHPNRYLAAKADFNGDGVVDTALMLVNDSSNKMGLFVFLSNEDKFETILLDQIDDKFWVDVMGLSVVYSGQYKTACGKGYWECEKGVPEVLVLERPAINYFNFESASSFFVWNAPSKSFNRIWISD